MVASEGVSVPAVDHQLWCARLATAVEALLDGVPHATMLSRLTLREYEEDIARARFAAEHPNVVRLRPDPARVALDRAIDDLRRAAPEGLSAGSSPAQGPE